MPPFSLLVFTGGMSQLVSASELADLLERGEVKVLDVQYALMGPPSHELYAVEHLPGAPHLPLEHALAGPAGLGGRHPLPDPAVLEQALRKCGINEGDAVVVYDQATSLSAGRAWWTLRWAGLSDVRVLDGGLWAWKLAELPVSDAPVAVAPGDVVVRPGAVPVVEVEDVPAAAEDGVLLDVRAAERFRGEVEPIDPVAGHIPGAINLPMGLMQRVDGTFRSAEEIRAIAREHGVEGPVPVTTSCGSGVTAAQMVLALGEAGIEAIPYIGSWSGWITDPERPVATGP